MFLKNINYICVIIKSIKYNNMVILIMKKFYLFFNMLILTMLCSCSKNDDYTGLTLIPPGTVTNKVDLDVRAGIVNKNESPDTYTIYLYLGPVENGVLLLEESVTLKPGESHQSGCSVETAGMKGKNCISLKVMAAGGEVYELTRDFEVVESDIRSTRLIDGAWAGIYHWSEQEGKHWNEDIKSLTDGQWREMVRSMHKIGMDVIVIQEVFRNNDYVGQHSTTVENYKGRAFYPSALYPGRMPITVKDPLEAILSEADVLGMQVMMGVGMFAWFDFTAESLKWHKNVAAELWERYGHHDSFYGFYVSEECAGNLYNSEQTSKMKSIRKKEIADFFREFKKFTQKLAPDKPVMLATNSMGVSDGADAYPALLENLDILCPFGFARMPEGDLTGKEAAELLQSFCDAAGSHLWFDLEAFLFNPDMSLYPRPIDEIIHDLKLLDNFEKVLCYQFPGVFSDPLWDFRVGEERTVRLFQDYEDYASDVKSNRN